MTIFGKSTEQLMFAALHRVQAAIRPAIRNQANDEFDWADLSSVMQACRDPLSAEGFVISHDATGAMVGAVFMVSVETSLFHVPTGEELYTTCSCPCPPDRQEYAATVTVLRRVGLASLVGLVQEESQMGDGLNQAHRVVEARRAANQ